MDKVLILNECSYMEVDIWILGLVIFLSLFTETDDIIHNFHIIHIITIHYSYQQKIPLLYFYPCM